MAGRPWRDTAGGFRVFGRQRICMTLFELAEWVRDTNLSVSIRESILAFPVIEGTHLLGIGFSAGAILISDLRMAGKIFRKEPVSDIFNGVAPYMIFGFIVMTITGLLLMWSEPMRCYESIWFRFKVLFLFMGAANAGFYHNTIYRKRAEWDRDPTPPKGARVAAWASIFIWALVIITGRTMAYNF
jgi:hypothetical protein